LETNVSESALPEDGGSTASETLVSS